MQKSTFLLVPAVLVATSTSVRSSSSAAHADFINAQGQKIGTALLTQTENGVKIDVNVAQLPGGTHAFHVQAVGFHTRLTVAARLARPPSAPPCDVPRLVLIRRRFPPIGPSWAARSVLRRLAWEKTPTRAHP